jgi:hypothetical protein
VNITGFGMKVTQKGYFLNKMQYFELHSFRSTLAQLGAGYAVAQLVEALRYKSEGRGFYSRLRHWNFSLT